MKIPTALVSLLALAGTVVTAESADAAISTVEVPDDLREAMCDQDWYKAIELSSRLITSSKITPEHRRTLLDLRRDFYTYVKGNKVNPDEIVDCQNVQSSFADQFVQSYQPPTPVPQFSSIPNASDRSGTLVPLRRVNTPTSIWTVGTRVEGNSVRGTLLNNGLASVRDITLTIRSQQDDQPEDVKKVAIDTVNAWSEAEFVATFNHSPGNWLIESIEVN